MTVSVIDTSSIPSSSGYREQWRGNGNDSISLPAAAISVENDDHLAKAVFFSFKSLHHLLTDTQRKDKGRFRLVSRVASLSLGQQRQNSVERTRRLPRPARITLQHLGRTVRESLLLMLWLYGNGLQWMFRVSAVV